MLRQDQAARQAIKDILERCEFFAELIGAELDVLAKYVQLIRVEPGAVLFREGDAASFMGVLIEGGADILKQDSRAGAKHIGKVGPGKTIGEMAIVDREPRSATCVCPGGAQLIRLTREDFSRLIREYPRISLKILMRLTTLMSRRLRMTSGQLVDFLEDE